MTTSNTSDGHGPEGSGSGTSGTGGGSGGSGQGNPQSPAQPTEAPALTIIDAFGGIRPMAKTLGLAVSTVQGWKERSAIPANRHDQIRAAARKHNITLDGEMLRASAAEGAPTQPPVIEGAAAPGKPGDKPGDKPFGAPRSSAASEAGPAKPAAARPEGKMPNSRDADSRSADPKTAAPKTADPKSADAKPAAAPRRHAGFLPGLGLGVLLAAAVAGATIYTQPYWAPLLNGGASAGGGSAAGDTVAAALSDLDQRVADLQAAQPADNTAALSGLNERLATLEAALSQGDGQDPSTRAAVGSLNAQLARQTDRLAALEQDVATVRDLAGAPSAEVTDRLSSEAQRLDEMLAAQSELAQRLATAEADLDATLAAREAAPGSQETLLLLATLQLRDALQGSGPYAQPLAMLKNLASQDAAVGPIIAPLERRASAGLPSLRDLQAGFPAVARRIAAIEVGQEGEGWPAGVLRRLSEAVNLRPVGLVEGDAPTAVAARAEVKLNDGDLTGALAEIDTLQGAAAEAAASWRADAEARLAANRAVNDLGVLVSQRFSGMAGG